MEINHCLEYGIRFVCGALVTSNGMRGRKRYDTAVMKVNHSRENSGESKRHPKFCLRGGCNLCYV